MSYDHDNFEDRLRSLPTAVPPEHVRNRILTAAAQHSPRRGAWRMRFALALGLLLLISIDLGVGWLQDVRIASLMGKQPQPTASPINDRQFALAIAEQRAMVASLLGKEELR